MAKQINIDTKYVKTYANLRNLEKAVEKFEGRYMVCRTVEGRLYPVFIGSENAHVVWHGHAVTS